VVQVKGTQVRAGSGKAGKEWNDTISKDGNAALEVAVEAEAEAEAERLCCTRHGNATTGKSRLAIGGVGQR